jgi:uncharacterized protein YlxW (UPF0749 family)
MEARHTEPSEDWAKQDAVQKLMKLMLDYPEADHSEAVQGLLSGSLMLGHAVGLFRALKHLKKKQWCGVEVNNTGLAFHVWLYHFMGGANSKLCPANEAGAKCLRTIILREEAAFGARVKTLLIARRRAVIAGESGIPFDLELASLRGRDLLNLVPASVLRSSTFNAAAASSSASSSAASSAPGDPESSPPGSSAEGQDKTAALVAFAMGTHVRLGEGYSSCAGPCVVRLLAGNDEVLCRIAAMVLELPPRTLAPPDRETLRLRRLMWQLEQELHAERCASKELRVQVAEAQRELAQSDRREESAAAALEKALRLAHERAEHAACASDMKTSNDRLKGEISKLKSMLGAKNRAHRREISSMQTEHDTVIKSHEAEAVARLRAQERELREYQKRMFEERNDAKKRAQELSTETENLSESLARVRATSKCGLLAQVRAAIALPFK